MERSVFVFQVILLSYLCVFASVSALSLAFGPSYFRILADLADAPVSKGQLNDLLASGVDSFVVKDANNLPAVRYSENCVLRGSKPKQDGLSFNLLRPLSERIQGTPDHQRNRGLTLWEIQPSHRIKIEGYAYSQAEEAFVICGDDAFVVYAMNRLMSPGSICLWRPGIDVDQLPPIRVWKLRSNPGIMGLVFSWDELQRGLVDVSKSDVDNTWNPGRLDSCLRKIRRPCSAMDYPPTIFMIGEDEIS